MLWWTSIRADQFRPIFYAPPVRRTIIDEQCSQPSSCLLVAGAVGLGRRKRACAKTARWIFASLRVSEEFDHALHDGGGRGMPTS